MRQVSVEADSVLAVLANAVLSSASIQRDIVS
jgi:hypothetical protein